MLEKELEEIRAGIIQLIPREEKRITEDNNIIIYGGLKATPQEIQKGRLLFEMVNEIK